MFQIQPICAQFLKNRTSHIFQREFILLSLPEQIQTHLMIQSLQAGKRLYPGKRVGLPGPKVNTGEAVLSGM